MSLMDADLWVPDAGGAPTAAVAPPRSAPACVDLLELDPECVPCAAPAASSDDWMLLGDAPQGGPAVVTSAQAPEVSPEVTTVDDLLDFGRSDSAAPPATSPEQPTAAGSSDLIDELEKATAQPVWVPSYMKYQMKKGGEEAKRLQRIDPSLAKKVELAETANDGPGILDSISQAGSELLNAVSGMSSWWQEEESDSQTV
mmetsp:Transcript_57765/g.154325  ORF Transcript_57765/g.154325 Transcript_57765/m.154325 type:complete len:200 (+) Transcript_57765:2-601(+)